jgi:hypothetical protein
MPDKKKRTQMAILFTNGNTAFLSGGRQIEELQEKGWFEVYIEYLESKGVDLTDTVFKTMGGDFVVYKKSIGKGYYWELLLKR